MDDMGPDDVLRLDAARALALVGPPAFREHGQLRRITEEVFYRTIGDVILARRGMGTSYHLSAAVDDAAQGITLVTRGEDLLDATWIHVLLQRLLDLPTPDYWHHRLIRDDAGQRLAKRNNACSLRTLREEGTTPAGIRQLVGL